MKGNYPTESMQRRIVAKGNGRARAPREFTATNGYRVYHARCERTRLDR